MASILIILLFFTAELSAAESSFKNPYDLNDLDLFMFFALFFSTIALATVLMNRSKNGRERESKLTKFIKDLLLFSDTDSDDNDLESFGILSYIKSIVDEDSNRVAFNNAIESKTHPLLFVTTAFIDEVLTSTEEDNSVLTTIPLEFSLLTSSSDGRGHIAFTQANEASPSFYTAYRRHFDTTPLTVESSDGSPFAGSDDLRLNKDSRSIVFAGGIQSFFLDAVNGKKCLISVEPFLLESQMKRITGSRTLNADGVYLFMLILSGIILLFSFLNPFGVAQ